ncbi:MULTISPECIES: SDR family NAD(P)-dependent oxidoreductase [Salinibaculum]|uniref:SDR family NAD(P)-dependent oxidoreductase n=1 Tax=Salinibaculum TaxID=2732368 RepID=UPI0030CBF7DC
MTDIDLTGKTAWVTGSARNIGKAIAAEMAASGANVVVSNRSNEAELDAAVADLRERFDTSVIGVQTDVSDPDAVLDAVETIGQELGPVDILVNNAAVRPHNPVEDITLEEWNTVVGTNLTGPFLCARAVVPDMREAGWGRIITMSGADAMFGQSNRLHVASTKAGLFGYTRALAHELAEDGITSNCIAPGIAKTDRAGEGQGQPDLEPYRQRIPLGYICDPEEIAPTATFLASDHGGYITGQVVHVNGGLFPTIRF